MISLEVRDPVVYGEIEWISVRIHGQSFMLHQIVRVLYLSLTHASATVHAANPGMMRKRFCRGIQSPSPSSSADLPNAA